MNALVIASCEAEIVFVEDPVELAETVGKVMDGIAAVGMVFDDDCGIFGG